MAEVHATSAAVADVEHPRQFRVYRCFVVEVRLLPADGLALRRLEVAFPRRVGRRRLWRRISRILRGHLPNVGAAWPVTALARLLALLEPPSAALAASRA